MNINSLNLMRSYLFDVDSRHQAVKTLKNFLSSYSGISGLNLGEGYVFDTKTQAALAKFQKSQGLLPTGKMDLRTWFAVGAEMTKTQIQIAAANDNTLYEILLHGHKAQQTALTPTLNSSFIRSKPSSSARGISAFPKFVIKFYVSVFAPFEWFGPFELAKGDGANRRFGINPAAGYRMQGFSEITAVDDGTEYPYSITTASDATTSTMWIPYFSPSTKSECYINDSYGNYQPNGAIRESVSADYHLYGNDDAIFFVDNSPVPDIDVHPKIWFNFEPQPNSNNVIMHATGKVVGDQFPAVEVFILDRLNNGVILGVFQVRAGDSPEIMLPGDKRLPMIDIDLKIMVENGIFTGVLKNERLVSLAEHNSYFINMSPVKPKYSGSLPAPDIRPK